MKRAIWAAGLEGRLLAFLQAIPEDEWNLHCVHTACLSERNLDALRLLLSRKVKIDRSAAHAAANNGNHAALELLCAAGADLRAADYYGEEPLQATLCHRSESHALAARALIANGVRISTMAKKWRSYGGAMQIFEQNHPFPALIQLERHIDAVRRAAIALLRAKAVCFLGRWDKFLLKEIALQMWADRANE